MLAVAPGVAWIGVPVTVTVGLAVIAGVPVGVIDGCGVGQGGQGVTVMVGVAPMVVN